MALAASLCYGADTLKVERFRYAGPFNVKAPVMVDSLDLTGKAYERNKILESSPALNVLENAEYVSATGACDASSAGIIGFSIENMKYAEGSFDFKGLPKDNKVYVDGKPLGGGFKLEPGTHDVAVRFLGPADSLSLAVICSKGGPLKIRQDGGKIFSLDIDMTGTACSGISISPSGSYAFISSKTTFPDGKTSEETELIRLADSKILKKASGRFEWMQGEDKFYFRKKGLEGTQIIVADAETLEETVLCENVPEGHFYIVPGGKKLIMTIEQEGPKEGDVHEIISPDDRQPGWRDRSSLAIYDIASGVLQPLTFGVRNIWLSDISRDGKKILYSVSTERLTQRPTTLSSVYCMDLETLESECLIENDGFIGRASFSPDGTQILVDGSPEAFGGIGCTTGPEQTPSMVQKELFILNPADKSVRSITKNFDPNVDRYEWSLYDGKIYTIVEEKDILALYRINPKNGKAERVPLSEEYVRSFSLAESAPVLVYSGQSLENATRAYSLDTKKLNSTCLRDYSATLLDGVTLGKGGAYEFKSSRGDIINGFYVLPPDFDATKKYPLLVHYYGGCSPSNRYCIGSYSPQYYAAQGYVFYVVNPSGATGFGQEFAARHVNTAGDVVADDIIEGVENFCKDHPFIDSSKIGCFSASYGGFMTQLLLSKTDIFATGISHAGISDHTSYWGEGYWGYSYSEVSMANSYPWTRKDLYVDRSPLYFADKIHTPILFLHGSADTNVPIGESIQMFTAMKLLGNETAFVVVDGENHGIVQFDKKKQWLRTISAWFAKYLQDDSTWWDTLYPNSQNYK